MRNLIETKTQERIAAIKAEIASYGNTKWWYYTVKRLEDELKELQKK